jgi:hypothetical protein
MGPSPATVECGTIASVYNVVLVTWTTRDIAG